MTSEYDANRSLDDYLVKVFDQESADLCERFFHHTGLPMPDKYEFYITTDEGALVLLPFGAVISLRSPSEEFSIRHPNNIRSIYSEDTDQMALRLYPGLDIPYYKFPDPRESDDPAHQNFAEICHDLDNRYQNQFARKLHDLHGQNIGFLPGEEEFPIILDPGCLEEIVCGLGSHSKRKIEKQWEALAEEEDPQAEYLMPLEEHCTKFSMPATATKLERQEAFWKPFKLWTSAGLLSAQWRDYCGTGTAADRYEERLNQECGHLSGDVQDVPPQQAQGQAFSQNPGYNI